MIFTLTFFLCVRASFSIRIAIGTMTGEDATDRNSLKFDDEAEYSGYCRYSGYNAGIIHALDHPRLCLSKPMAINDIRIQCRIEKDWKHIRPSMSR